MRTIQIVGLAALLLVGGCEQLTESKTYTLYRNSPFGLVRVHWATFNADERDPAYNLNNCEMAARLLNANVAASAKADGKEPDQSVGFWCENGPFKEKGAIPAHFEAAFPTDI